MKILQEKTKRQTLNTADNIFDGPMVKAVVDIDKNIIAIDADLHADLEQFLLKNGSAQDNLWGINLYPEDPEDFIEFDSMINVRPRQGNRSRDVENPEIRQKIIEVVSQWFD